MRVYASAYSRYGRSRSGTTKKLLKRADKGWIRQSAEHQATLSDSSYNMKLSSRQLYEIMIDIIEWRMNENLNKEFLIG